MEITKEQKKEFEERLRELQQMASQRHSEYQQILGAMGIIQNLLNPPKPKEIKKNEDTKV